MREESEVELPNPFTDGLLQTTPTWVLSTIPVGQPSTYIIWMETTYMGGQCLNHCQLGDFCWIDLDKSKGFNYIVDELAKCKDCGYLSEVDVVYPRKLHEYHNDLPFMCAKMKMNGVEKLVPNLYNKCKYVIHIKALKQAIDHGLVLEKIHRAIEFKQSAWI